MFIWNISNFFVCFIKLIFFVNNDMNSADFASDEDQKHVDPH